MKSYLEDYMSGETLVDFQVYSDPVNTFTGFVSQFSDTLVLAALIDDDGTYDGFSIFELKNIFFVRSESRELLKISQLAKDKNDIPEIPELDLTSFQTVISDMKSRSRYISVHIENIDNDVVYIGDVIEAGDFLVLDEYPTLDEYDRPQPRSRAIIRCKDITRIEHGGKYERKLIKKYESSGKLEVIK